MNPLKQFVVKPLLPLELFGVDITLTNSALFMILSVLIGVLFVWGCTWRRRIIPSAMQSLVESLYLFVQKTAETTIGSHYKPFMPFMFSVFIFVFMGNALGLVPYGFTFTSQLIPVGAFALLGTVVATICGIHQAGFGWLRTFLPKGIPAPLAPIIIPIEMISFLSKPFSLTVRLMMNMIVGHVLLKILAGFVVDLGFFGVFPLFFACVLIAFEFGIAFLQAYVYTVLTGIYLSEAVNQH